MFEICLSNLETIGKCISDNVKNKFQSETLKIEGNFCSKMLKLEKHILLIFFTFCTFDFHYKIENHKYRL